MPFTGSGKNVYCFRRADRQLYSWDTQESTRVLVSVLNQPWQESALTGPKGRQGYARADFPFKDMDEGTARLLNYIAVKGNDQDKAALVKTIFRSSAMGRLGIWSIAIEGYKEVWDKFLKHRQSLKDYAGAVPGSIHTKGNYFESTPPPPPGCDVLYVDPPKIIGRTDIYCGKGFKALNAVLEQHESNQPEWVLTGYLDRIRAVLSSTNWKSCIFFYSSGLVPTLEEIIELFPAVPEVVKEFPHGSRADYGIVVTRTTGTT